MHAFLYACHDLPYDRGARAAVTKTRVRIASGVCRVKEEVKMAHLQEARLTACSIQIRRLGISMEICKSVCMRLTSTFYVVTKLVVNNKYLVYYRYS